MHIVPFDYCTYKMQGKGEEMMFFVFLCKKMFPQIPEWL